MSYCEVCEERFHVKTPATTFYVSTSDAGLINRELCEKHKRMAVDNIHASMEILKREREYSDHELLEVGNKMRGYRQ